MIVAKNVNTGQMLSLFGAIVIIGGSFLLPATETLSVTGIRTIALAVTFLFLLVREALPLVLICWITLALMQLLGIAPSLGAALIGFAQPVVVFILASLGIAAAFTTLPLSKRVLVFMLKRFGKNMKSFLLAIMVAILPITAFVSSVPTVAVFMAIALSFLDSFENEEEKRRTGKALMIALPVACLLGGIATPVGSVMNLLVLDLLAQHTGMTISFLHWMVVGVPIVVITTPICWLLIYHVYKPAEINPEMVQSFIKKLDVPPKMCIKEKKALVIVAVMFFFWIGNSWIYVPTVTVALLGACALFLPGIGVLDWNAFFTKLNFTPFFLVGTVLSLGTAMVNNGVADWLTTFLPAGYLSLPALIAFTVVLVFLVLVIMPVGPSVVVFLALPLMALAQSMGHSPAMIMLVLAMAVGNCFLLPFDTIPLITYSQGYYKMMDMPKTTLPIQIFLVGVITVVVWVASAVLGIV